MAIIVVIVLACLSYLALSSGTAKVLNWILNFCTAATMLNWAVIHSYLWCHDYSRMTDIGILLVLLLPLGPRLCRVPGWQMGSGYFCLQLWHYRTSYCHRDFLEDLQAHKVAQERENDPPSRFGRALEKVF
ncbi:hypothetical protein V2G26_012714 [Clonostachys chloroleuca]